MSSSSQIRDANTNLLELGYQDRDNPTSIYFYFKNFASKEEFVQFLNDYKAGSVFMPMPTCTRPMYKEIVKTCNKKKLPVLHAKTGDAYKVGDANVKIVHTGLTKPGLNYNNYCTVVRVTYKKKQIPTFGRCHTG